MKDDLLETLLLIAMGGIGFYFFYKWYKQGKLPVKQYCAFIRVPGPQATFISSEVCASTPEELEDKLSQTVAKGYAGVDIVYYEK